TSWSKAAEALEIAIDYQKNVHPHFELITENYFEEKEALDNCWISIIQIAEQIIEYRLKDAEAINNDRNKFDKYCSEASIYLNDASSLLNEVTTGNKEKIEEITLFIQVAKQAQRLAHQWIDAAQECERGNLINANEIENKIEKNKSLSRAAKAIEGLKDAAVYLKKATKATAEGEEKKAKDWTEAAKFSSTASRDFLKAIEDYDANRESDGGYVENFGFANLNVAEQLAKEIEANIEGHRDEFEEREELIKQNQLAHEYNTKSKDQKNASWQNAAWGIICATEKYNNAIIAKCTNKSKLYEAWIDIFTLCKQAINSFETAANKIDEGPDLHNIPYDAPRGSYYAALKAATVANEGKIDEGASWNMVGFGYNDAADELTKAIEAEEDGMLKLAEDLRETAKQHKQSSECYTKSLKTYTTEETVENDSWNWNMAGFCYSNAAEATAIAIEIEDDGNTAVSQTLREASIKYQQSAGMYNKAAQYYSEGIDAIAVKFAALSLKNAADSLTKKADYQAKAAEARSVGEEALAIGYEEAAEKSETASSKYEQASQAFTEESENSECVKLLDAAKATQDEADQQSKIAEEKEEKCISRPTSITIRSQIIV
ncbi:MAG TPA: hypothetical protein VJK54_08690, partial [Chthoniobacterales bacterium]|nr:hypothetical protein [Chthoniobacterales bacterium]